MPFFFLFPYPVFPFGLSLSLFFCSGLLVFWNLSVFFSFLILLPSWLWFLCLLWICGNWAVGFLHVHSWLCEFGLVWAIIPPCVFLGGGGFILTSPSFYLFLSLSLWFLLSLRFLVSSSFVWSVSASNLNQSGLLQLQSIWVGQTMTLIATGMHVPWGMAKVGHMTRPTASRSGLSQCSLTQQMPCRMIHWCQLGLHIRLGIQGQMDSSCQDNPGVEKNGRIRLLRQANGNQG